MSKELLERRILFAVKVKAKLVLEFENLVKQYYGGKRGAKAIAVEEMIQLFLRYKRGEITVIEKPRREVSIESPLKLMGLGQIVEVSREALSLLEVKDNFVKRVKEKRRLRKEIQKDVDKLLELARAEIRNGNYLQAAVYLKDLKERYWVMMNNRQKSMFQAYAYILRKKGIEVDSDVRERIHK